VELTTAQVYGFCVGATEATYRFIGESAWNLAYIVGRAEG